MHVSTLPAGVSALKPGTKVEFGVVDGRRGKQALSLSVLSAAPSVVKSSRKPADDMAVIVEDLIKLLADKRISEHPSGTVINIGAHHAQKSHLMGTDQEWMGDYLAHGSPVADGSVFVIGFTSARTELEPGAGGTPFDIRDTSPDNEILRVMAETWPGEAVFLPLDDSLFAERTVAYNSEEVIYVTRLHDQFDALIQYGLSHRMPID